jgi:hypothetical protein
MNTGVNNREFEDFVRRQQESAKAVDWNKELDEWLGHLARLYKNVKSLLEKYVSSGQIRIEYKPVELNEEGIGAYEARQMILRIGRQEVDLVPIGTLLIGSKGRVDIIGPFGKAEMLLVDKSAPDPRSLIKVVVGVAGKVPAARSEPSRQIEWEWRILSRPPARTFIEVTQESLFQLIMEVANG